MNGSPRSIHLFVAAGGVVLALLAWQGHHLAHWLPQFERLIEPVNQALLSYALGAAGVPLRTALAGNLGMFTHMLPTVYFGAAAVHVTRMAGKGHKEWEIEGVLLMLGLAVCVALTLQITRHAWASIGTGAGGEQTGAPRRDS